MNMMNLFDESLVCYTLVNPSHIKLDLNSGAYRLYRKPTLTQPTAAHQSHTLRKNIRQTKSMKSFLMQVHVRPTAQ